MASEGVETMGTGGVPQDGWASDLMENLNPMIDNFQRASDEAIEMIYSAFNFSQGAHGADAGIGWGSVNKEGEGRKQFFFGDPSEYDLSEINGPRSQWALFKNSVKGFVQAIEWTEPWLIGLACTHCMLLLVAVVSRNNNTLQILLFVGIMLSVYQAERLNGLAAANWEAFSTQNYFDKRGVFVSTLWSTPLLLIGVVMLCQNLYSAASLLVQVKRQQIRSELRARKSTSGSSSAAEPAASPTSSEQPQSKSHTKKKETKKSK